MLRFRWMYLHLSSMFEGQALAEATLPEPKETISFDFVVACPVAQSVAAADSFGIASCFWESFASALEADR